jgi:hypothetical protein
LGRSHIRVARRASAPCPLDRRRRSQSASPVLAGCLAVGRWAGGVRGWLPILNRGIEHPDRSKRVISRQPPGRESTCPSVSQELRRVHRRGADQQQRPTSGPVSCRRAGVGLGAHVIRHRRRADDATLDKSTLRVAGLEAFGDDARPTSTSGRGSAVTGNAAHRSTAHRAHSTPFSNRSSRNCCHRARTSEE